MRGAGLLSRLAAARDHAEMGEVLRSFSVEECREVFREAAGGGGGVSFTAYIDGACRGNPGPMGGGVVILDGSGKVVAKRSRQFGKGTNNRAEYHALILALEEASRIGARRLRVMTDSELLANQMNARYRIRDKAIGSLASRALELMRAFECVEIESVPREQNRMADTLANASLDADGT